MCLRAMPLATRSPETLVDVATNRWKTHKTDEEIKCVLDVVYRRAEARAQRAARGFKGPRRRKPQLRLVAENWKAKPNLGLALSPIWA